MRQTKVNDIFIQRWSPRAFDEQVDLSQQEIEALFNAARWAPSSFNEQPWTFHLALHHSQVFDEFLDLLDEQNKQWAKLASALIFVVGKKKFSNGKENKTYQFDCGSAWMSLTLQANMLNLFTHAMAGIARTRALSYFDLDEDTDEVICAFAIGKRNDSNNLPEGLAEKEGLTGRKKLEDILIVH